MTKSIKWYSTLDINKRIAHKELAILICGMSWNNMNLLFSLDEKIELVYNKLLIEGFNI